MKPEYDFSKGVRGKFYREDAKLHPPIYLDDAVQAYLEKHAKTKGVAVSELVNELLRRDIELIEAVKA